ncbi:MAG: UvrD-helicase domain-containing protein [Myxococcaceae bacterium]|nr:UvrD-helicase domain-containing protein [Myxococcaceae bacterium]
MSFPDSHDAAARNKIATALDQTLVVEAAAGTGKTTALVGRIVAIVRAGKATLKQIIAVTFTEKAAGEMKLRLRGELEKSRQSSTSPEEKLRLETALEELEVARIGTIHALCADLLREHPIEARVDPLFEVSKEPESQALLDAAFDAWLPATLTNPGEGVRRLLRRRPRSRGQAAPRELLRRAAWQLVGHRDFTAAWRIPDLDREALLDALLPPIRELAKLAVNGTPDDYLKLHLKELERFIADLDHREPPGTARDYDGLEAALATLARHRTWSFRGFGQLFGTLQRAEVVARRDALKAQLDQTLDDTEAHLAAHLHQDLWPLVKLYEEEKRRSGKLDFFDLLIKLNALLVGDAKVRNELQDRFTHLFIDEFQDTDPLQADILRLLAADDPTVTNPELAIPKPGKLFIVGDPKQSIYRFRRADVALYETIKRRLKAEVVDLTTSFRGTPKLQGAINAAFAPVMVQEETGTFHTQARYVPLTRSRPDFDGQPCLVALPVPRPYNDYGKVTTWAVDRSYPDAAGAFVDWLVSHSGWKVQDPTAREPKLVPVEARHVCVLFRRFRRGESDVTLEYTRALEARGIPHVLVGGRSFHGREEVLALRNALTAIEWPDDELSIYATLRGPLFALSDDALLAYRETASRGFRLFRRVDVEKLPPAAQDVSRALDVLQGLHKQRNRRPIGDTLASLLEETRAHAGVAFWVAGEQALANLAQLVDQARRYEANGGRSFRGFVDLLAQQAERGEVPEAPIVEEASEGVRIMTVHGAKGLEFPVVLLADPTCKMTFDRPSQWVDPDQKLWAESLAHCVPQELRDHAAEALKRDYEEGVRLTYVAATRARDLLVVPAVGDEELADTWLGPLHPVIYPGEDDKRRALPAPGCPNFGGESVLDRPEKARFRASVQPGLHRSRSGQHEVVWWDPATLELDKRSDAGLHQDQVLHEKGGEVAAAQSIADYEAWAEGRARLLEQGSRPSLTVEFARDTKLEPGPVLVEETKVTRHLRPSGRRFGKLVHHALADVPLSGEQLEHTVNTHARRLGATDEERSAAVDAVKAALAHPLLGRAKAADVVRREAPLTLTLDDGTVEEGIADLAFREGEQWVVVEFKTDHELAQHRPAYERQLTVYARAVAAATGQRAVAWLLSV